MASSIRNQLTKITRD